MGRRQGPEEVVDRKAEAALLLHSTIDKVVGVTAA